MKKIVYSSLLLAALLGSYQMEAMSNNFQPSGYLKNPKPSSSYKESDFLSSSRKSDSLKEAETQQNESSGVVIQQQARLDVLRVQVKKVAKALQEMQTPVTPKQLNQAKALYEAIKTMEGQAMLKTERILSASKAPKILDEAVQLLQKASDCIENISNKIQEGSMSEKVVEKLRVAKAQAQAQTLQKSVIS